MKVDSKLVWSPFERGYIAPDMLRLAGMEGADVWVNNRYEVWVRVHGWLEGRDHHGNSVRKAVKHLSIKRKDKEPVHDWRDLQRIKNELCGTECEGMELYPAESRLIDQANQYHLFVFEAGFKIPFGFDIGRCVDYSTERTNNSKQRGPDEIIKPCGG